MLRVGLTGGLGSGKSFIGAELERLGCLLVQADELGHQVLAPGAEAYDPVVREFGEGILNPDRTINRTQLAEIVFRDPDRLAVLNSLVHPPVRARRRRMEEEFFARNPHGIAVMEAAILVETGSFREFDRLIVAACRPEQQAERALERTPNLSRRDILERISRQIPLEQKMKFADYIIDTSGTKQETLEQTRRVYEQLRSLTI